MPQPVSERVVRAIKQLACERLVSVTLMYHSGPGTHDVRYKYTNMSGASLQTYRPADGFTIVGVCSLDDEWD